MNPFFWYCIVHSRAIFFQFCLLIQKRRTKSHQRSLIRPFSFPYGYLGRFRAKCAFQCKCKLGASCLKLVFEVYCHNSAPTHAHTFLYQNENANYYDDLRRTILLSREDIDPSLYSPIFTHSSKSTVVSNRQVMAVGDSYLNTRCNVLRNILSAARKVVLTVSWGRAVTMSDTLFLTCFLYFFKDKRKII